MNPSEQAKATIQNKVESESGLDWTQSDQEIANGLNALTVDNPETQQNVPKPYSMQDVMGQLNDSTIKTVRSEGNMSAIADAVRENDDSRVLTWASAYKQTGDLSDTEYSDIESIVTATHPDPNYESTLNWAQETLGRSLDANDISESRP